MRGYSGASATSFHATERAAVAFSQTLQFVQAEEAFGPSRSGIPVNWTSMIFDAGLDGRGKTRRRKDALMLKLRDSIIAGPIAVAVGAAAPALQAQPTPPPKPSPPAPNNIPVAQPK